MDEYDDQNSSSELTVPQDEYQDGVVSLQPIYQHFVLIHSDQPHFETPQSDCDSGEHTGESLMHSLTDVRLLSFHILTCLHFINSVNRMTYTL